jgi:hypothetical protein
MLLDFSMDQIHTAAQSPWNEYQDLPGDKGPPARKDNNFTAICEPIV